MQETEESEKEEEEEDTEYDVEAITGGRGQDDKSIVKTELRVLWSNGDITWESCNTTLTNILYGIIFDEDDGMQNRQILYTFAKGSKKHTTEGESLDAFEGRKAKATAGGTVTKVHEDDVTVKWESARGEDDDCITECLSLHEMEKGCSWGLVDDAAKNIVHGRVQERTRKRVRRSSVIT